MARKLYQVLSSNQVIPLDAQTAVHCRLLILVSEKRIKFSVVDVRTQQCLHLVSYALVNADVLQAVVQLYEQESWLHVPYWESVTLCIDNQQYVVIPTALFQPESVTDYLRLVCPLTETTTVRYHRHTRLGMVMGFAVSKALLAWFEERHKQSVFQVIHQGSSLLEGAVYTAADQGWEAQPVLFVWVTLTHVHLVALYQGKLRYYNRFAYKNAEQLLYYVRLAMHILVYHPKRDRVCLGGVLTDRSLAYRQFCQCFQRLTSLPTPDFLTYPRIDPGQQTDHFEVLSAYLCPKTS